MPQKLFKKLIPSPAAIKSSLPFEFLGEHIHDPNLWRLNKKSVSRAVFIGIFCAFLPIPLQMLLAAVLAILFTANLPLSVVIVWISNPFTFAPLFYACYQTGVFLLGGDGGRFHIELNWEWLRNGLPTLWKPLLTGSLVLGTAFAFAGYFATLLYWRSAVLKKWQARSKKRMKIQ